MPQFPKSPRKKFRPFLLSGIVFFSLSKAPSVWANDPILLNDYAIELLKRNEYEKALEQLQQAFGMFPYDRTLRRNLAEAYSYVGKQQMDRNAYEEAAANFGRAGELFPDDGKYGLMRGIALYGARNYDAASIELERARANGEQSRELYYFLGRVQYDTGNLTAALETWEKAVALDPGNALIKEQLEKARRESVVEGRMDKGYSSRFSVSHDVGTTTTDHADEILSTLEEAYNKIGSDFSHFPTARIPVILYTRKDYRSVTASPDWSGGLYDGKIRLPVGNAPGVTPLLRGVLFHEYTHVVVNELTAGNCPTWLNEGLAVFQEQKVQPSPLAELEKAARRGTLLSVTRLEKSFSTIGNAEVRLAYEQSYSIVNYMVDAYGWHKVREVLVNLGKGMKVSEAISAALKDFGLDYPKVVEEWQAHVRKQYSR